MQINLTRVDQDNRVPEGVRILFWDGIAFDIGIRHGEFVCVAETDRMPTVVNVKWIVAFKEI